MAADISETITEVVPAMGKKCLYFTAAKTAQNDTITFGDYSKVLTGFAHVDGGSDWGTEIITVDQTTATMINLTSTFTGTIHGYVVVEE